MTHGGGGVPMPSKYVEFDISFCLSFYIAMEELRAWSSFVALNYNSIKNNWAILGRKSSWEIHTSNFVYKS